MEKFDFDWHNRFLQQAAWTKPLRDYLFDQTGLVSAPRILEVGCGTGALLQETEKRFCGEIFGLDINPSHLFQASSHSNRSHLLQADAHAIPFPTNTFDLTICHFLLLWVKNPIQVVREMARLTRPGGHVLALAEPDYGGRIDYPFELGRVGELQQASLQAQGANPLIGRQIQDIFIQAGLLKVQTGLLGGEWKREVSEAKGSAEWSVFEQDCILLPEPLHQAELEKFKRLDRDARKIGSRVLFVPTFYAWGRK